MASTEVQGGDMRRLLDTLATNYGGSVDELLGAAARGEAPPPIARFTPPPIAHEAPTVEVEPQPWERPSWRTAAAPVTRAGADIHMRSATAMAVCGATEVPLASVADPTQVTCRACRLMVSAPHISPCSTERWLRDAPAPEPEHAHVVDAPPQRGWRLGTAATLASAGVIAATLILGAVAIVALSGHNGPTPTANTGTTPAITTGGSVADPTAFATALPTVAPSADASPAPTGAPTATPAATQAPSVQNQNVTVINDNGQSQQQSQRQGQAQATSDPAASGQLTSLTFINQETQSVQVALWNASLGAWESEQTLAPGYQTTISNASVGMTFAARWSSTHGVIMQVTATASPQTVDINGT